MPPGTTTPARIVVLDTETTGFSPAEGHRIVEIGCVEMLDMRPGAGRQWYLNPDRDIPEEATRIHGITNAQVAQAPRFGDIAAEFLEFIGDAPLVIHNASFDLGFLNAELRLCRLTALSAQRAIDTVALARRRFPGATVNLDALCRRFNIDNTHRTFHGALLDSHLLAQVYVELTGGNQFRLDLPSRDDHAPTRDTPPSDSRMPQQARHWPMPEADARRHADYLDYLDKECGSRCLWRGTTPPAS
ncbi:MAG: DNA polymerase III subunit epsilon [Magnetococcus sp. WYHC-3]